MKEHYRSASGLYLPRSGRVSMERVEGDDWYPVGDSPDGRHTVFADGRGGVLKVAKVQGGDSATAEAVLVALNGAGPAVGATAAEVDLLPAQALPLINGIGYWAVGKTVHVTAVGTIATGAAPGNLSLRVRYGGSATTGVVLADTGAIAMTASIATLFIWRLSVYITCRAHAAAGSLYGAGWAAGLTSVTPPVQAHMGSAGPTAPAAVAVDTTLGTNAFRVTALTSAAVAATQLICNLCTVETMN